MATKTSTQTGTQSGHQSGNFPLDNLTFDLVTLAYEKSKGLEAYDKYIKDAQGNQQVLDLFERMRQHDEQCVQEVSQFLGQMLSNQQTDQQSGQQGAKSNQTASGQSRGASASSGRSGSMGKGSLSE